MFTVHNCLDMTNQEHISSRVQYNFQQHLDFHLAETKSSNFSLPQTQPKKFVLVSHFRYTNQSFGRRLLVVSVRRCCQSSLGGTPLQKPPSRSARVTVGPQLLPSPESRFIPQYGDQKRALLQVS
ncbi:hypothetical protein E2C01_013018 [Portunus trituberculatus]|uniref:Uncharacterized protein n=1 Tax=Portunus trituberculatus TaxID=210409 RepID=A0A5B7DFZ6_PORTR|nr:hypothetical protein [Portunus trituberculatus]